MFKPVNKFIVFFLLLRDFFAYRVVILGLSLIIVLSCNSSDLTEEILPVSLPEIPMRSRSITLPVKVDDLFLEIRGSVVVTPTKEIQLYFREPGRLKELNVSINDKVQKNQILAKLESVDLEHQLSLSEIDLEITLKNTDAIFHTSTSRLKKQIAELELQKQTAHTNYLRNRLEHYIIRAPFPGIITSAKGKVGEIIQEYRTLIEISDPSELELQMKINVDEFHTLAVGQEAFVELVRDSWEPAKVIALTSRSQSTIPTLRKDEYIAHISLNHPKYELISNQRFPSKVITESRYQTLVIPAAGLREFRDRTYVRILEDEIRREVDVKVGIRTETHIEIISGLEAEQLVISK